MKYVFDLSVSGNTSAQTSAAIWQVGSGFGTANSIELNPVSYARFALNLGSTPGEFSLRDPAFAGASSSTFSGTQRITWILNNTGSDLLYTAPDSSLQTLLNDTADLWIGSVLGLDGYVVTTATQSMTDLKFVFSAGSGMITMDNFDLSTISAIPEPDGFGLIIAALLGSAIFIRHLKAVRGSHGDCEPI